MPAQASAAQNRSGHTAAAVLAALPVKGRAAKTGYDRARFGATWTDDNGSPLGHNGCDTRNDILRRDLVSLVLKPGSHGCAVLRGVLHDPYTGATLSFLRGPASSSAVQIDHVVSLSDGWQTGAARLTEAARVDFANDPLNLLAVDGSANEAKGDGDAATWLPPDKAYRCAYVARQIAVKARYGLWLTPAEHDAAARVLGACPGQAVPVESSAVPSPRPSAPDGETAPASSSPGSPRYRTCAEARAAGAAPLHRGDPGYDRQLDGDGDGVACE